MQAPTHVLAGVLIQKVYQHVQPKGLKILLIAVTALLLHSIFDRIAKLTYHPPDPDFSSVFWVSYHLIILIGFIISLYFFWKPYKLGIIFSILPDFDWVIIHGSGILGIDHHYYSRPWLHTGLHYIVDRIPPFSFLQYLPDNVQNKSGIWIEVLLIIIMLIIIRQTNKGKLALS